MIESPPPPDARFVVTGTPIPYARAQTTPSGRRYTDPKSKKYRNRVGAEAFHASRWTSEGGRHVRRTPAWPDKGKCKKVLAKYRRKKGVRLPACSCSYCSDEYRVRLLVVLPDRRTRDLDNIEKNILDACTGILWWDDRQAFVDAKERAYSKTSPRVEVEVRRSSAQEKLAEIEPEDESPFPGVGWETERAREWLRVWVRRLPPDEEREGSLAALLRDCWASGFLEGMDGDPPPSLTHSGHLARCDILGKAGGETASKPGLRLVDPPPPKETDE